MNRERIVILGGGMAALTTAFELTSTPGWEEHYEVTVYQQGHRLGGKGASGRNHERFDRIEEHGLHLFYGFYDNAFSVMRRCYEELGRPAGAPLATLEEAFEPHSLIVFEEQSEGVWQHQPLLFPRNSDPPGLGRKVPTPAELIPIMLQFLLDLFDEQPALRNGSDARSRSLGVGIRVLRRGVARLLASLRELLAAPAENLVAVRREELLRRLLAWSAAVFRRCEPLLAQQPEIRSAWAAVDITLAMIRGMIADGLTDQDDVDWLRLDHEDFRAWLRRHGASEASVRASTVSGVYAGAYSAGREMGAGTALHWTLRMLYTYRGAIFYKMQAGMGDVIFAPLYQVLRRRGVHFRFFHRIDRLRLSADRRRIAAIEMGRQIAVKGGADYEPLFDVKGLPCWPSEPLYDQLIGGEALRASGESLEDWGSRYPDQEPPLVLEDGRDFDRVVLGVGLGVLPALCEEIVADANNPRFAAMIREITTTPTVSSQLWIRDDLRATGWHLPPPVMIPYAAPLDTWADMSHLLSRESFPEPGGPQSIAYLTAAMDDDEPPPIERSAYVGYAARQLEHVRAFTAAHLDASAAHLWPAIVRPDGALDRSRLHAPASKGDPLAFQHFSPVQHPSDRYVLSPRGTTRHRLAADESGYENLVLAGDWTLTPMNLGCVEAATMSGIRAAQVLTGLPIPMHDDWLRGRPRAPASSPGPLYIERGVNESTSPPYDARSSVMVAALLRAEPRRLRDLCARHLGLHEDRVYIPLGPSVVFYAQDNRLLSAIDAPGVVAERDFGFLVPVAICERRGGRLEPLAVGAYTPYLWVDLGAALVGGREVLGFPKGHADLGFEATASGHLALHVDAWLPPEGGGAATPWRHERIVEARDAGEGARETSLLDALRASHDAAWLGAAGLDTRAQVRLLGLAADSLRTGAFTMVFLKQFRDAARREIACYQAIVEAPCRRIGAPRTSARLPRPIELSVSRRVGLASTLGLVGEGGDERVRLRALASFYMELDFTIGVGEVVTPRSSGASRWVS
ncbi:NAD(P)-binding protein [Polyangium jinanense]|uniref:NAD(P)-binding protein n=1 Tax=Polyangium jinanense TaxID=2829994 RepID=A0A9X3X904_9BACT|nr:NAD(P)-binding protein [Polyangium jinanense]MDC3958090.1 NAD(P)-binding protein [Polyangium jinanense]MDC3983711.1 NAD(P)-binding protein [Polyangium jinanense]